MRSPRSGACIVARRAPAVFDGGRGFNPRVYSSQPAKRATEIVPGLAGPPAVSPAAPWATIGRPLRTLPNGLNRRESNRTVTAKSPNGWRGLGTKYTTRTAGERHDQTANSPATARPTRFGLRAEGQGFPVHSPDRALEVRKICVPFATLRASWNIGIPRCANALPLQS